MVMMMMMMMMRGSVSHCLFELVTSAVYQRAGEGSAFTMILAELMLCSSWVGGKKN